MRLQGSCCYQPLSASSPPPLFPPFPSSPPWPTHKTPEYMQYTPNHEKQSATAGIGHGIPGRPVQANTYVARGKHSPP